MPIKTITTIDDYCREINIPGPKYPHFDVRRFEDNMKTVNEQQAPFRHEFYAIALRHFGTNKEVMGRQLKANLFFNSPYQIITWDIKPDWVGWYILFDKQFISGHPAWLNFIVDYPFFRLDQAIPFSLPEAEVALVEQLFVQIEKEYQQGAADNFNFIYAFTQLLLHYTKRHFNQARLQVGTEDNRSADVLLVSRFQSAIETAFGKEAQDHPEFRSVQYYADLLHTHPNHLNAVVKRITEQTALQTIQKHMIVVAKAKIRQTESSISEIAYQLHFTAATHFNAFFKKHTGLTPKQFRLQLG